MSNCADRILKKIISLFIVTVTVLAARGGEVENLLQTEMTTHHVAGVACLVISNGIPVTQFFGGNANLEWPSPVDGETVFEIGSVSKQFCAASILLLVQDGKLSVDDRLTKFFTNLPPAWTKITVRQLLTHTSGIKSYDNLDGFELRQHLTQRQFIERLGQQPLEFAPGKKWHYCNAGYSLLGYLVENVSGKNYWDLRRCR